VLFAATLLCSASGSEENQGLPDIFSTTGALNPIAWPASESVWGNLKMRAEMQEI
jgi:hypothetical protein